MIKLPEGPYTTTKDLIVLYNKYNKLLFNSECPNIVMKIQKETGKGLAWAKLDFEDRKPIYIIRFNRKVLNGAFSRVQLILIHEMIHIYLYKIGMDYYNEYNRIDGSRYIKHEHGPLFLEQTKRIKGMTGLTITVVENDFEVAELQNYIYFISLNYLNGMFYAYQVPAGRKLTKAQLNQIVTEARTKVSDELIQKIEYRKTKNSLISFYPELTNKHTLHSSKKLKWIPETRKESQVLTESELIESIDLTNEYGQAPDWVKSFTAQKSFLAARATSFPEYCKFMLGNADAYGYITVPNDTRIKDWLEYTQTMAGPAGYNLLLETWKSYSIDQLVKDERFYIEKMFLDMENNPEPSYFEYTKQYFGSITAIRISEQELYARLMTIGLKTSLVPRKQLHKYLSFITGYKGQPS